MRQQTRRLNIHRDAISVPAFPLGSSLGPGKLLFVFSKFVSTTRLRALQKLRQLQRCILLRTCIPLECLFSGASGLQPSHGPATGLNRNGLPTGDDSKGGFVCFQDGHAPSSSMTTTPTLRDTLGEKFLADLCLSAVQPSGKKIHKEIVREPVAKSASGTEQTGAIPASACSIEKVPHPGLHLTLFITANSMIHHFQLETLLAQQHQVHPFRVPPLGTENIEGTPRLRKLRRAWSKGRRTHATSWDQQQHQMQGSEIMTFQRTMLVPGHPLLNMIPKAADPGPSNDMASDKCRPKVALFCCAATTCVVV